jgi:peptidase M28-like protein
MTRVAVPRVLMLTAVFAGAFAVVAGITVGAQAPEPAKGVKFVQISPTEMKAWLDYLASDDLQGRQVFTEGYGLAASYVAERLKDWRLKPAGDAGTYFENVKIRGYKVTRNSSVTLAASEGASKTFKHGDHVTFAAGPGGKQTLTFAGAEFIGYGQAADLRGRDVKDKLVIWMPNLAAGAPGRGGGRGGAGTAINTNGAAAAIGFAPALTQTDAERTLVQAQEALRNATEAVQQAQAQLQGRGRGGAGGRGRGAATPPDFTTAQRVDAPQPPQFTGDESFFEALFAGSGVSFADLRAKAQKGEALSPQSIRTTITITVDNTFEQTSEQRTRNVVGVIEGTDPKLKDTYVMFGAHLDHVGYSQTGTGALPTATSCRARTEAAQAAVKAAGRVVQNPGRGRGAAPAAPAAGSNGTNTGNTVPPPFEQRDIINNGADDDGSGSTALLAIAKAFATGPKPKRSVVFVWHAGEEAGLQGSRFNADFPVVPLGDVQAVLNMDMVGRDDCNNVEGDYSNSVFVVGADRISTDLHNVIVQTNATLASPLTLDYELNDPLDPEGVYTRSDHFSYARKGVPISFFTTGLHPDYHKVSDSVDKIVFPKMARIAQLVYQTGFAIANSERALVRDNKGPRTGFGSKAEVIR